MFLTLFSVAAWADRHFDGYNSQDNPYLIQSIDDWNNPVIIYPQSSILRMVRKRLCGGFLLRFVSLLHLKGVTLQNNTENIQKHESNSYHKGVADRA